MENEQISNTDLDSHDVRIADTEILKTDETYTIQSGRKEADSEVVGKCKSNRLKERMVGRNVSTLKVLMVNTAPSNEHLLADIKTVQQKEANSSKEIKQQKEADDADQKEQDPDEHLAAPELDNLLADLEL